MLTLSLMKPSTFGERLSDFVAETVGSWTFIIVQSILVTIWIVLNVIGYFSHWDPYPFILLNLLFSVQSAYAAPIIMMSQNRQSQRDRMRDMEDYDNNLKAKETIEVIQMELRQIEHGKINKVIDLLEDLKDKHLRR